ncbi:hypothetical protein MNBD_GAMMA09-2499 [hydrothermal vent metagenome]|uniref:Lipoprotein n=1 Tax=hydrothermal vent metagenome TaxID=652676 RepID=A0A3B0XYT4_9ZZZZ
MKTGHSFIRFRLLLMLFLLCFIVACSSENKQNVSINLLSITVKNSEVISHVELNHKLVRLSRKLQNINNLYFILSQLWPTENAYYSSISINRINDDSQDIYTAILIFDNIPDDDSVSGFRYDIRLKRNSPELFVITQAKRSWRCWEDRGHRYFDTAPCS